MHFFEDFFEFIFCVFFTTPNTEILMERTTSLCKGFNYRHIIGSTKVRTFFYPKKLLYETLK